MISGRTFVFADDETMTMTFRGKCIFCGEPSEVTGLTPESVAAFDDGRGAFIQDAFSYLSAGDRETILSGAHESCFDAAFPEDEEEVI